jgi:predicted RNase H-like nuclease (RuvC/YqgF family)
VQVRLSGKRLDRIQYRPLTTRPRYLIVGIDPGTTVGIAALDLNGELVKVHSSRQMGMGDVIEFLYSLGKPIVIASDVSPMPFSVEKIRRAFQAVAYTPRQDISVEVKYELAGRYSYGNDHERDALTAAIEASRYWRHKFEPISRRVPQGIDLDEVKAGIIRGKSLEITLESIRLPKRKVEEKKPEVTLDTSDERVRVLDGLVKDLRGIISDLQTDLRNMRTENQKLKREVGSLRSAKALRVSAEPEVAKRDLIIENLKKRLRNEEKNSKKLQKRLKRMKEAEGEGESPAGLPVKVLPDLSRESIRQLNERIGIRPGDLIAVRKPGSWGKNSLHELAAAGVRIVILGDRSVGSVIEELAGIAFVEEIAVVAGKEVPVLVKGDYGTCDPDLLEDALAAWNDELEKFRRGKSVEMINGLFQEYRAEREREVRKGG